MRGRAGPVCQGGHQHRCSRRPTPGRRRQVVRQILERADGGHCVKDRGTQGGGVTTLMTGTLEPLTKLKEWQALKAHYETVRELHLRELLAADPQRGERMTAKAVGLFLDYSKKRVND